MTVWFAQNSGVNIDSVNQWNDAANGSGNWLTWESLDPSDILVANGKTSITINVNVTCSLITSEANGGTAGGNFLLAAGVTVTADLRIGGTARQDFVHRTSGGAASFIVGNCYGSATFVSSSFSYCVLNASASDIYIVGSINQATAANGHVTVGASNSGNVYITGNIVPAIGNFYASYILYNLGSGSINVTGNIINSGSSNVERVRNNSTGKIVITGDVTAGAGIGITNQSAGTVLVNGTIAGSSSAYGYFGASVSSVLCLNGNLVSTSSVAMAAAGGRMRLHPSTAITMHFTTYDATTLDASGNRSLYTGGINVGHPAESDVRFATVFGATSEYTGSLRVPDPSLVALGVLTDDTTGTYAPAGGLDEAELHDALDSYTNKDNWKATGFATPANLPAGFDTLTITDGKVTAELDTATLSSIASIKSTGETTQANMYTRFDTVDSTLGAVQNVIDDIMDLTRLVRSADDQKAIVFAFPDASLDLSPSTVSIDGATAVAVTGAITYVGTQDSKFYYSLAWNAADRPSSEGTARYFFNDGDQYFRYIDLRVEVAALSSVIESQLTSIEDGVDGNAGYLTSLTSSMATLLGRVTAPVYAMWLDLIAMITGSGVNPKFTTAAVSNAPSGGGGSGAESDLMVSTTIDALTSQTVFTLVDGSPDNDAYNDQLVVITDADTSTQKSRGIVSDYVASTKTITLRGAPGFTIAAGDAVAIIAIGSDVSSTQLAGAVSSAIATASIPVTVTGIPTFLRVGDARTVANGGAISVRLYSADDDSLLFGLGTQLFEDATITFSLRRPGNDGTEGAEEAVIPCTWVASGGDGYVLIAYEGDALDGCDAMDKVKEKACHRWGIKFQWGSDDPITPVYGNVSVLRKIVSTQ